MTKTSLQMITEINEDQKVRQNTTDNKVEETIIQLNPPSATVIFYNIAGEQIDSSEANAQFKAFINKCSTPFIQSKCWEYKEMKAKSNRKILLTGLPLLPDKYELTGWFRDVQFVINDPLKSFVTFRTDKGEYDILVISIDIAKFI